MIESAQQQMSDTGSEISTNSKIFVFSNLFNLIFYEKNSKKKKFFTASSQTFFFF